MEGVPEVPNEPNQDDHIEAEPVSYERALIAAKTLFAQRLDPFDDQDPEVLNAQDVIAEWHVKEGLHMRGNYSLPKAMAMVQYANLWLEAGYVDRRFVQEAIELLNAENSDALAEECSEEVKVIFGDAIDALERKLDPIDPKEKIAREVSAQIDEAIGKAKSGDPMDAIRLLTSISSHPKYKRHFSKSPQEREYILALRAKAQEIWRNGVSPEEIDMIKKP